MPTFTPPTYWDRPSTGVRLIDIAVKIYHGYTVLKAKDGSYSQVTYPTSDDLAAAAAAYLGGHVYPVSDAEAAALTAAGYGAYLT